MHRINSVPVERRIFSRSLSCVFTCPVQAGRSVGLWMMLLIWNGSSQCTRVPSQNKPKFTALGNDVQLKSTSILLVVLARARLSVGSHRIDNNIEQRFIFIQAFDKQQRNTIIIIDSNHVQTIQTIGAGQVHSMPFAEQFVR